MRTVRFWTLSRQSMQCLSVLVLMFGLLVGQPTLAQGVWETMHPDSFERSTTVARQQCERTAGQSSRDALTSDKCAVFEQMLTSDQCRQTIVPDGIVFDYMNYQHTGESPSVQGRTVKRLGSNETKAAVCNLGDGVTAYWFNEVGAGCNNVAFQLPRQINPQPPILTAPPPRQRVCRLAAIDQGVVYQSDRRVWHVPGYHTNHSACGPEIDLPDASGVTQSTIRSTAIVRVCD